MVGISLGGDVNSLFSKCRWLVSGEWVFFFPLSQARKCLTFPVPLQYLKYQIVLLIMTNALVPSTVRIINN